MAARRAHGDVRCGAGCINRPECSAVMRETAARRLHWLEYHDWIDPVLVEPLVVKGGHAHPSARPGSGLEWDEGAVRRRLVE